MNIQEPTTLQSDVKTTPMNRHEYLVSCGFNGANEGTESQLKAKKGILLEKDGLHYWLPESMVAPRYLGPELLAEKDEQTQISFKSVTMTKYSPTSLGSVKASPMDLGSYNVCRGWAIPPNEDPKQEGYLVMDECRPQNHPLFNHGITWLPKQVFEATYKASETYLERLHNERTELHSRAMMLESFLEKTKTEGSNVRLPELLELQLMQQKALEKTLGLREAYASPCDAIEYEGFEVPALVKDVDHATAMFFAEKGFPVLRKGWNGKGIYVFVAGAGELNTHDQTEYKVLARLADFTCIASLDKNKPVNTWAASPTDIRAKDWVVLFKF